MCISANNNSVLGLSIYLLTKWSACNISINGAKGRILARVVLVPLFIWRIIRHVEN